MSGLLLFTRWGTVRTAALMVPPGETQYIPCAVDAVWEAVMDMVMKTEVIEEVKLLEGLPVGRRVFN